MNKSNFKILIIGPIFNTVSGPTGQPGQLYTRLKNEGYEVIRASHYHNKIIRMIHTLWVVVFRRKEYDIILLQSFGLLAFVMEDVVSRIAKVNAIPIVFSLRGGAFYDFYLNHPKWVRRVLLRASYISSPSRFLIHHFKEEGIQVNYLPNAIDFKSFTSNSCNRKKKSLLWVRAFHDIYNPELAIEVVKVLKKEFPDISLTMIGKDQGSLGNCMELIKEYNLSKNIVILGFIPHESLPQYYQTHEVFLTTTRFESFGNSLMEAGSSGIPSVCVPVGEIPYLWEHNKNILFAERDVQDFSNKVRSLFLDSGLRERLSEQAKQNTEKFSWDLVLLQWKKLINEQGNA